MGAKSKTKSKTKPKTIDEYLAGLSKDKRNALQQVRKTIQAAAPDAEECISYEIPAFRLHGKGLIWFGAAANHCAVYGVDSREAERKGYDTSGKGTIRFPPEKPLPSAFVRKLVKARIAKVAARGRAGKA